MDVPRMPPPIITISKLCVNGFQSYFVPVNIKLNTLQPRLISYAFPIQTMLPDRCSVMESGKQCVNPPEFIVSIVVNKDEYMVGVACGRHKQVVSCKIKILQDEGKIPNGKIGFSQLKAIGTDCIHGDSDDFIQLDSNHKN